MTVDEHSDLLSPDELDVITELVNIGVGRAAAVLNQMVNSHVQLTVPRIVPVLSSELHNVGPISSSDPLSWVELRFDGGIEGTAALCFPTDAATKLIRTLTGDTPLEEMDEAKIGALLEIGNIVLNGIIGSLANSLQQHLDYEVPAYYDGTIANVGRDSRKADGMCLAALTRFEIEESGLNGMVMLFIDFERFRALVDPVRQAV